MKLCLIILSLCLSARAATTNYVQMIASAQYGRITYDSCDAIVLPLLTNYVYRVNTNEVANGSAGTFTNDLITTSLMYSLCYAGLLTNISALYLFETLDPYGDQINAINPSNKLVWNSVLLFSTNHTTDGISGRWGYGTVEWVQDNQTNMAVGAWINNYVPYNFAYDGDFMTPVTGDFAISISASSTAGGRAVDANNISVTNSIYGTSGGITIFDLAPGVGYTNFNHTFMAYMRYQNVSNMVVIDVNGTNQGPYYYTDTLSTAGVGFSIQTQWGDVGYPYADTKVGLAFIAHDLTPTNLMTLKQIFTTWATAKGR